MSVEDISCGYFEQVWLPYKNNAILDDITKFHKIGPVEERDNSAIKRKTQRYLLELLMVPNWQN